MAEDDDRWLEGLAGRALAGSGKGPDGEGAVLRAAILGRRVAQAGTVAAADPRREAVLIARARRVGLLPARPPRRTVWWASLAAVLACVAAGLSLQLRAPVPVTTLRGASAGVMRIHAAQPLQLKQELLRELNAAGIRAVGYQELGRQGIDADLPTPLPAAVRDILVGHGIPLPSGNVLQLEIEPQDPP